MVLAVGAWFRFCAGVLDAGPFFAVDAAAAANLAS